MFTGIIEQIAEVVKVESEGSNVHISLKSTITSELKIDQSVAHNGVCLTVVKINGNEYIDRDINIMVEEFSSSNSDMSLVCFESIHPRYSHAVIENDTVERVLFHNVEGSKACTGMVWFRDASMFFDSACKAILKKSGSETSFYFNEVVNQMILDDKTVTAVEIESKDYYPLKGSSDLINLQELLRGL